MIDLDAFADDKIQSRTSTFREIIINEAMEKLQKDFNSVDFSKATFKDFKPGWDACEPRIFGSGDNNQANGIMKQTGAAVLTKEAVPSNIKQISWFDQHFYGIKKDNKTDYYPSVTTILQASPKPYLSRWRGDIGNSQADHDLYEAAERGTRIHLACEILAQGGAVIYNSYSHPIYSQSDINQITENHNGLCMVLRNQHEFYQVYKALQFFNIIKPLEILTEQMVYSDSYQFAGTMDLILNVRAGRYNINGSEPVDLESGYYICDWKSSNNFSDDYFLQISAYAAAYMELHPGFEFKGGMILHTNAKTTKGIEGFAARLRTFAELEKDFVDFLKIYEVYKIRPSYQSPKVFDMPSILKINN